MKPILAICALLTLGACNRLPKVTVDWNPQSPAKIKTAPISDGVEYLGIISYCDSPEGKAANECIIRKHPIK